MSTITNEEFQEMLEQVASEHTPSALLSIPGVYEVLSEHFNNEVIKRLERDKQLNVTPADLGAVISFSEIQGYGSKACLHVRIEVPNGEEIPDEYELSFPPAHSPVDVDKCLKTPLREWRVI